jgi:hypothetical protein
MRTTTKKPLAKKRNGGSCKIGETGPSAGLKSAAGKRAAGMKKATMSSFGKSKFRRSN